MKVRFLADADLNKAIVNGVLRREPAIDFMAAQTAGLRRMKDSEVLALAAGQQRVLVSHDVGTMPAHFRAFTNAGRGSAGVFLIPQNLDIGTAIEELLLIWIASDAYEWVGMASTVTAVHGTESPERHTKKPVRPRRRAAPIPS